MTEPIPPSPGTPPRRLPRLGDSNGPVLTIAFLVAAAVAVVIGLSILRSVSAPEDARADDTDEAASTRPPSTSVPETTTTSSTTTTTTLPPASKTDATVVVANASGIGGSATAMSAELAADGYATGEVANATGQRLEASIIYFDESDPRALGVARLIAEQIPTAATVPLPPEPPLDRPLGDATVALLLGRDVAGRSLEELARD